MNWKKFLMPTWEKIIIFLVLSFLFIPFITYDNDVRCIVAGCDNTTMGSMVTYLLSGENYIFSLSYLNLIGGLIIAYLISCLIITWTKKRNSSIKTFKSNFS